MENQSIPNQKMENLVDLPLLVLWTVVKVDMAAAEDTVAVAVDTEVAPGLVLVEDLEAEEDSVGEAREVEDTEVEAPADTAVPVATVAPAATEALEDTAAAVAVVELVED